MRRISLFFVIFLADMRPHLGPKSEAPSFLLCVTSTTAWRSSLRYVANEDRICSAEVLRMDEKLG